MCSSDPGSQYTSHEYKRTIASLHGVQSMGGVGTCYDNARMESFFATLKKEKLYRIDTKKLTIEMSKNDYMALHHGLLQQVKNQYF